MANADIGKRQIFNNLIVNFFNFAVNVSYGLLITPFLIRHLGLSSFGLVQIGISVSMYIGLVATSLNQANNRYLAISLTENDDASSSSILTTTLVLYLILFMVLLPIILLFSFNADVILSIREKDVIPSGYMFTLLMFSYFLILITSVFVSPLYAKNRLDIIQGINILRNFLKLVLTILIIVFVSNNIAAIGASHFFAVVISVSVAIFFFVKYVPFYRFRFNEYNKVWAGKILRFSGWSIINSVGVLLFLQTDIIVVNIMLGPAASGHFGILVQWSTLLLSVATITSVVISPIILIKYSQKRYEELVSFLCRGIRFQGLFISLIASLIFVYAPEVLELWVGEEFVFLALPLRLLVFHVSLTQAIRPLYAANVAYNKLKLFGKITLIMGLCHLLSSVCMIFFFNLGIIGVVTSRALFQVVLNVVVLPIYVAGYVGEKRRRFFMALLPAVQCQVLVLVAGFGLKLIFPATTWVNLGGETIIIGIVTCVAIYTFLLAQDERKIVVGYLQRGRSLFE